MYGMPMKITFHFKSFIKYCECESLLFPYNIIYNLGLSPNKKNLNIFWLISANYGFVGKKHQKEVQLLAVNFSLLRIPFIKLEKVQTIFQRFDLGLGFSPKLKVFLIC